PGWRAQPEKPVPSYPMSSLTRISAERRVPGPPGPASSTPAPAPWALLSVLLGRIPVRRVRLGRVVFGGGVLGGAFPRPPVLRLRALGHRVVGRSFFCPRVLGRSLLGHRVLSRCFLGQGILGHRVLSLFDRSFLGGSVLSGHVPSRDVLGCGTIGTGVRGLLCRRGRRCGLRPGRAGRGAAGTAPPRPGPGGPLPQPLEAGERGRVPPSRAQPWGPGGN